jgi:hypothetical protein
MTPETMTSIQLAEQCARDAFEMLTDWLLNNVPDEVNWEDYAPDVDAARDQAYKAAETLALACKAQGLPTIRSKAPAYDLDNLIEEAVARYRAFGLPHNMDDVELLGWAHDVLDAFPEVQPLPDDVELLAKVKAAVAKVPAL